MPSQRRSIWIILVTVVLSLLYALPNLFPDVPIIDLHYTPGTGKAISNYLASHTGGIRVLSKEPGQMRLGFDNTESQMKAKGEIEHTFGSKVSIDINLLPNTPSIFQWFGAHPMKLGLDLRGGVHLLLEVDTQKHTAGKDDRHLKLLENIAESALAYQKAQIIPDGLVITFASARDLGKAKTHIEKHFSQSNVRKGEEQRPTLHIALGKKALEQHEQYLMQRTLESIQNRVNELGLSEAIVTQQGHKHISVDLPGIQDIQKAKALLGNTSTLSFHLVQGVGTSATTSLQSQKVVPNTHGTPLALDAKPLLTGDAIVYAVANHHEGKPVIQVQLESQASHSFYSHTQANIGNPMAIVLSQSVLDTTSKTRKMEEKIISAPVIQDALKHSFVISGIPNMEEAETLALLLRSGSLAAPVDIVSQSTVGPSLGAENIQKGIVSIIIGLGAIMAFMLVYYRKFGLIANFALLLNLSMMLMLMSWLEATMTLPAMAAIVLSVGMAVDANVLINERIREELREGKPDELAATLGYEKAFSSIFDANITTLIVAGILYLFSGGVIKGFAITLIIGLLASLYTSVFVTRVLTFSLFQRLSPLNRAIGVR